MQAIYDIFPTILHIMGIPIPKYVDGRVLNEIFEKHSELAERHVIYSVGKERIKKRIKEMRRRI